MCNSIPGNGRRGRRLRCTPRWRPRATSPAALQHAFYPAIAELDLVLAGQFLVKMPQIKIEILLPIELQHPLQHRHRHPLRRRLASPPAKQPAKAALLVTFPPPPHVPVADANDLRRLKPRNLLRHCLQHHFLYFHRPLHRGPQVRFHASHGLLLSPPAKRTYRVLTQPDISCANDTAVRSACTLIRFLLPGPNGSNQLVDWDCQLADTRK